MDIPRTSETMLSRDRPRNVSLSVDRRLDTTCYNYSWNREFHEASFKDEGVIPKMLRRDYSIWTELPSPVPARGNSHRSRFSSARPTP